MFSVFLDVFWTLFHRRIHSILAYLFFSPPWDPTWNQAIKLRTRNGQYLSDSFGDKKVQKIIPSNGCTNAILFAPKISKVDNINSYHDTNTKMLNRLIYCSKMGYKSRNIYKVEIHWLRWLISVDIVLILLCNTNLPNTEIIHTMVEKPAKNYLCKIII